MSKIDKAIEWALSIANDSSHGYDQSSRWGPNYDCSSFLITVWEKAGVPVKTKGASYTGNMKSVFLKCGFKDVTGNDNVEFGMGAGLQRGDILLHEQNHVAMYIGGGQIVQASINERGGITGGQSGDQTGGEIHVRYTITTRGRYSFAMWARMPERSRKKLRRKPWEVHPICVRLPFPFYRKEAPV